MPETSQNPTELHTSKTLGVSIQETPATAPLVVPRWANVEVTAPLTPLPGRSVTDSYRDQDKRLTCVEAIKKARAEAVVQSVNGYAYSYASKAAINNKNLKKIFGYMGLAGATTIAAMCSGGMFPEVLKGLEVVHKLFEEYNANIMMFTPFAAFQALKETRKLSRPPSQSEAKNDRAKLRDWQRSGQHENILAWAEDNKKMNSRFYKNMMLDEYAKGSLHQQIAAADIERIIGKMDQNFKARTGLTRTEYDAEKNSIQGVPGSKQIAAAETIKQARAEVAMTILYHYKAEVEDLRWTAKEKNQESLKDLGGALGLVAGTAALSLVAHAIQPDHAKQLASKAMEYGLKFIEGFSMLAVVLTVNKTIESLKEASGDLMSRVLYSVGTQKESKALNKDVMLNIESNYRNGKYDKVMAYFSQHSELVDKFKMRMDDYGLEPGIPSETDAIKILNPVTGKKTSGIKYR